LLLIFPAISYADCTIDSISGDTTCCKDNVCMTYDSPSTAQAKAQAQAQAQALANIQAQLDAIDKKSMRSVRSCIANPNDTVDCNYVKQYESQAQALRAQLSATPTPTGN